VSGDRSGSRRGPGIVLQNELEAPPALFGDWLAERGIEFRVDRAWEGEIPERPDDFGWVASLGSAQSVNDDRQAWIGAEVDFLRRAAAAEVPVLGICFGGQALAAALGGEVFAAERATIAWLDVETANADLVPSGPWAHFNTECFTVPEGAEQIAATRCGSGAFRAGPHLGVQFHPEATPTIVDAWAASEGPMLAAAGVDPQDLSEQGRRSGEAAAKGAFRLFDAWWALADGTR
jgi:GMP synthase-like glutamine amidotransferase